MKLLLVGVCILALLLVGVSCQPTRDEWITLDLDFFTIKTPKDWTAYREQGIDTHPGGLTNKEDTLTFDYGRHAGQINNAAADQHLYGQATINGRAAMIQLPRNQGEGALRVSFPHASEEYRFNIGGYDITDTETVLEILKTIRFKGSDTTRNKVWTREMFKPYPFGSGRTLYDYYCTSCHLPHRDATGPAMFSILETRSNDWIVNFLYKREMVPMDSLYQARITATGDSCMRITEFTRQDAEQIAEYLREP